MALKLLREAKPDMVVAVEPNPTPGWHLQQGPRFRIMPNHAAALVERKHDVSIYSWPPNKPDFCRGALKHLPSAETVIVIGEHTGGTVVGLPVFWQALLFRTLEMCIRSRHTRQFLAIYGAPLDTPAWRGRYQEERSGVSGSLVLWKPQTR
jgi:hypothetical protein